MVELAAHKGFVAAVRKGFKALCEFGDKGTLAHASLLALSDALGSVRLLQPEFAKQQADLIALISRTVSPDKDAVGEKDDEEMADVDGRVDEVAKSHGDGEDSDGKVEETAAGAAMVLERREE